MRFVSLLGAGEADRGAQVGRKLMYCARHTATNKRYTMDAEYDKDEK